MDRLLSLVPARLRSGWTLVALVAVVVLAAWLPDLDLPFGDSDDGRILARFGLQARNFWELGPAESAYGASMAPYNRLPYAHHPPLQNFLHIGAVGIFGEGVVAHRILGFTLGAATVGAFAATLRARAMAWGPTIVAAAAIASTGFYFVYMRQGGGFSFLLAAAAVIFYLAEREDPPRWMLVGAGVVAFMTASHSWISIGVLGLLTLWLLFRRPRPEAAYWIAGGALLGLLTTFAWMLAATDVADLTEQVGERADTMSFTLGEFLARQWDFAGRLTPLWFQWLVLPALVVGLWDKRTRLPVAVTLFVAAGWTFSFQQGAWTHVLWNLPWLAPVGLGMAALFDWVRRRIPETVSVILAVVLAGTALWSLYTAADGRVRNQFIALPSHAGELLVLYEPLPETNRLYLAGIGTPRWAPYYWDVPFSVMRESDVSRLGEYDFILVRTDRAPDYLPADISDVAVDQRGRYALVRGNAVLQP